MTRAYEQMEQFTYDNGIVLLFDYLPNNLSGFYYANSNYGFKSITLNRKLDTTSIKTCVLAEEIEHYISTPEDLFTASKSIQEKYEYIARFNAIKRLMPFEKLVETRRFCDIYELADYLNITFEFLEFGLKAYKEHYGLSVSYRDFIIFFDPFDVEKAC